MPQRTMMSAEITPMESKRAMATAVLFANIFRKYLEQNRCEYVDDESELNDWTETLLDHVNIVGGFCRDLLLNRAVNDINIILNLRELTKHQWYHLKKYHSTPDTQVSSCRCVYWQRFLHKLTAPACTVPETMHNANYIFNADFWMGVLLADPALKDKVVVQHCADKGYLSARLVSSVIYGGKDCIQQRFDIVDTFEPGTCDFMADSTRGGVHFVPSDNIAAFHNKSSPTAQLALSTRPPTKPKRLIASEYIEVLVRGFVRTSPLPSDIVPLLLCYSQSVFDVRLEKVHDAIPIYAVKLYKKLELFDFSINTCILPMSVIVEHYNSGDEHKDECIALDLIENSLADNRLDRVNAFSTFEKILRAPVCADCSIKAHPTAYVFWRIVRWMIREPTFQIDAALIKAQRADFDRWVTREWFATRENCAGFMSDLQRTLERECRHIGDVEQMFRVMQQLHFTQRFARVLKQSLRVRQALTKTIRTCDNVNQNIEIRDVEWAFHKADMTLFSHAQELVVYRELIYGETPLKYNVLLS